MSSLEHTITCNVLVSGPGLECLHRTMTAYLAAVQDIMQVGRVVESTGHSRLHHLCYHEMRTRHGLNANLVVRGIARAAGELKEASKGRDLTPRIDYDRRICKVADGGKQASFSTVCGRIVLDLPLAAAECRKLDAGQLVRASIEIVESGRFEVCFNVRIDRRCAASRSNDPERML